MAFKVVDAEALDNDLKSVADAIRAKGGTSEALAFPEGFNSAIESIETGGVAKEEQEKTVDITANGTVEIVPDEGKALSKVTAYVAVNPTDIGRPYIDTSKMTYFQYFFSKNPLLLDVADDVDTSNGTDFSYMFNGCSSLTTIPQLDTSKGTSFTNMFYNCSALTSIPQLDISRGTSLSNMFYNCSALTSIPQLDTSKGTNFGNMFNGCSSLTTIPQLNISKGTSFANVFYNCTSLETLALTTAKSNLTTTTFQNCTALKNITIGEGWAVNIYLHYSNNLTVESLHGMIENLADLTGQTAKTFQIGATNLAKVDEEHINMLKAKNWNYS